MSTTNISKIDRKKELEDVFPLIMDEIVSHLESIQMPREGVEWLIQSFFQNALGGKLNRGLTVVDTYEILKGNTLCELEFLRAAILGWCVELLQAFFLVEDDIMDGSKTRRGQTCWYLQPHVGMIAINDGCLLQAVIYFLLKKHFRKESYYVDLVELFSDTSFQTMLGQLLDLVTAPEDNVNLSKFSLERYSFIVIYKTAFYSFYLPVALAMYMSNVSDPIDLKQAKDILIPLGEYFQVQDDYLDCFGDPAVTGKIGTDIQDNKCSWVVNIALQKASPEQRQILDQNYGRKDAKSEKRVREVFDALNIVDEYHRYEEDTIKKIQAMIECIDESRGLKKAVFAAFVSKIYKRSK
ncbi:Farnesyl pyrophosphate synthase [Neolecta irregularis DAH-3]|uniref:Farnesyl pyrophosphate synthase n=1 Tax=Neolecta irregularis (strain DAH-3) TaxID=1198029 RepID=A0A1U7LK37_NEOID|nr:Farnesyl pyrophosphate synthase [Neolecta irregularis DAH-3]|eukprot:OLL22912.1 Farnesyl pyrophosphate synthase [Neolecta irregularis DAH-3]